MDLRAIMDGRPSLASSAPRKGHIYTGFTPDIHQIYTPASSTDAGMQKSGEIRVLG
jgi:hypothetical protein